MSKYQYILLDWDGNLAKTLDIWLAGCRIPLLKRGIKLSDIDISSNLGQVFSKYPEWGVKDLDVAIEEANDYVKQNLPSVALYPDALTVLKKLHELKKNLALITSSRRGLVFHLLEKYNLVGYFDLVVAYEDVKEIKPHPEPLLKALKELGGNKEEAIMIGDSVHDLKAAQNAGIDSILFYPEEHRRFYNFDNLKKHNPTYIIEDFQEVIKIVD